MTTLRDAVERLSATKHRQLAWSFFVLFSRAEYALKRCGYIKKGKPAAEADWDAFALSVKLPKEATDAALTYLREHAPRKQLQSEGELRWSPPIQQSGGEHDLVFICRCIAVVRNNLFHGGKFQDGPRYEPVRDQQVVQAASEALFSLIDSSSKVRRAFLDDLPGT